MKLGLGEKERTRIEDTGKESFVETRKSSPSQTGNVFSGGRGDFILPFIYSNIYLVLCWFPGIQRNRFRGQQGRHQGTQWRRAVGRRPRPPCWLTQRLLTALGPGDGA